MQRSRFVLTLLLVIWSLPSFGQLYAIGNGSTLSNGDVSAAKYPHPYLVGGLQLQGGGYAPTAWAGGVGVNVELKHLVLDTSASYATAHKVNDNTINNILDISADWTAMPSIDSISSTQAAGRHGASYQRRIIRNNHGIPPLGSAEIG